MNMQVKQRMTSGLTAGPSGRHLEPPQHHNFKRRASLSRQGSSRLQQLVKATAAKSQSGTESSQALPQKSTSGSKPAVADWSKRLLAVAKEHKSKQSGEIEADVFKPAVKKNKYVTEFDYTGEGEGDVLGPESDVYEQESAYTSDHKRLPSEMRFFDTARIFIGSGDGGNGCVAFRREKFVEFGGPAGGCGGRGGNVWAVVDYELNSLTSFRHKVHWRADSGTNGEGSNCDGAHAGDLFIPVPAGTIIRRKDADEGEQPLAELLKPGDKALLATGGRGGRGNFSFKTSRNNAPTIAERGEKGLEMWVDLELKVVADVGIVGVPNAGKSTLLSVLTAARPKIANYPFTTLVPNLGVCEMDYKTTVFADVPGLLEGAHEGLGLGHQFLRHVQRCRVLVHVLDGTSPDPVGDFRAINLELELFSPDLKDKPQIIAYNKVDVPDSGDFWEFAKETLEEEFGIDPSRVFPISAATGQGVTDMVRAVRGVLDEMGPQELQYETDAVNLTAKPKRGASGAPMDEFTVSVEEDVNGGRVYIIEGEGIERFAQMTNWDYYEAVKRFQRVLDVTGMNSALKARGCKEGDTVVIGEAEFFFQDDQSQTRMYQSWLKDMKDRGVTLQGVARWPHPILGDHK